MAIGYETFGRGPHKVVALHGWFGDQTFMTPMRDALSAEEFTYVFPAYRGYGASRKQTGGYTVEEISADVRALIDSLGFDMVSWSGTRWAENSSSASPSTPRDESGAWSR